MTEHFWDSRMNKDCKDIIMKGENVTVLFMVSQKSERMRKKLPVRDPNPVLAQKPFDASRVAVLLAQEKTSKELYDHFVHFRIEKYDNDGKMELECHYEREFGSVGLKLVPSDLVLGMKVDFVEFCKMSIDRDFYVFIPIETSEISNYCSYKKEKNPHHIFIYGYDDEKQVFDCADFFQFSDGNYSFESVSFVEMENAFMDLQSQTKPEMMNIEHFQWLKDIQLLHSYAEREEKFSIQGVHIGLRYYLEERDYLGYKNYVKDVYYGYAIYDLLMEYTEQVLKDGREKFDSRSYYTVYLHFHYIRQQMEWIKENYCKNSNELETLIGKFFELEKEAKLMVHLVLKYKVGRNKRALENVVKELIKLKEEDAEILKKYIEYLEVNSKMW